MIECFFVFLCVCRQVKQDENVEVGHVIAAIAQGAASSTGASAPPTASAQQEEQPSASSTGTMNVPASTTLASETPPAPAAEHHGYQAQIAFPPRRAPDGGVLSMMPKEKAQEILQGMYSEPEKKIVY